jgi:lambda repressor-like predicted transcriptional regulator
MGSIGWSKRAFHRTFYLRKGLSKSSLHRVTNPATQCSKERPASVIWPSRYARSTANSTTAATAIKNHRIPDF